MISVMSPAYCTFRNNSSATLIHLFWSCHVTSFFWKSVTDWLQNTLPIIGKYILMNFITLGLRPEPHSTEYSLQLNHCLLLGRFHIWRAKVDLHIFFLFFSLCFLLIIRWYLVVIELIWHATTSVLANCVPRNCKQY